LTFHCATVLENGSTDDSLLCGAFVIALIALPGALDAVDFSCDAVPG